MFRLCDLTRRSGLRPHVCYSPLLMGNVERLLPLRSAERVAVLLNANARSVSDSLKRELENFVPPEDLYYSRCFDDARLIARQVLDKGYRTILTGGGDGTFVGYVNCLFEQAQQPNAGALRGAYKLLPIPAHAVDLPRFGVLKLGTDGKRVGRDIERGEVIYRGPCKMAAAGTVPNYGFGFQVFPFALRSPGRFQLRLTAIGVPKLLTNLGTLWRGGPPPAGILDFHCDKVLAKFDREMPLQVAGDAEGYRREVLLEMAERPLELLDFRARG